MAFILFLGSFLTSCQKQDVNTLENSINLNGDNSSSKTLIDNYEDVGKKIARIHNNICSIVATHLDSNSYFETNMINVFMSIKFDDVNKDSLYKVLYMTSLHSQESKDSIIVRSLSDSFKHYLEDIYSIIDNSKTVGEISNSLNDLNSELIRYVLPADTTSFIILNTIVETSKASAFFWYHDSCGGSGVGYNFLRTNNLIYPINLRLPGWAKADGRGAGYGMVGWAYSGAAGGPLGLLLSAGFSAAFSSLDYKE